MSTVPEYPLKRGEALRLYWRRLRSSPLAYRLARGSFWSLVGSVVSRSLGLGSAILAARILGKSTYGELGIIQTTLGLFGALAGFGMGTTASKFVAEFRTSDPAKAGRIIALSSLTSWVTGSVLAVVLIAAAPWLCQNALAASQVTGHVQAASLLLFLSSVNGAQVGVLSGMEAFRKIAFASAVSGLCNFPLVIGGAWFFGLGGVVGGMTIAQAIGCLANYVALRTEAARYQIPIRFSKWSDELSVLWRFSVPAVLGGVLMGPVTWACTAMVARQPQGLEQVGALNAANQWFGAMLWLPYVLSQAMLPMLSERISANDSRQSGKLVAVSIKLNAAIAFPVALIGSLFSCRIMHAYGPGFAADWPTLIVVLLSGAVGAIQIPAGNVIAALGRMWLGFCMNLLWAVLFLVGTRLLLHWGAFGLSVARLGAYVAQGLWGIAFALLYFRRLGLHAAAPGEPPGCESVVSQ